MSTFKSFAVGVARVAAIIVVVVVTLTVLSLGGSAVWEDWTEARDAARNAPLEKLKVWPAQTIEALGGVEVTLSTKWHGSQMLSQMLYQLDVNGYPPEISAARDGVTDDSKWGLRFLDKDGFEVVEVEVPLGTMNRMSPAIGQHTGLSENASVGMSVDDYRRAASWEIVWSGFAEPKRPAPIAAPVPRRTTPVPAPAPEPVVSAFEPRWRDVRRWRQLYVGMSRARVQELLGEPRRIEGGTTLTFWYYDVDGTKARVSFSSDGGYSWAEP